MTLPAIERKHEVVLLLGWTISPFVILLFILSISALLGWPKSSLLSATQLVLPSLIGFACLASLHKLKRWQWFVIVPYLIGSGTAIFAARIVLAILLGAPK